MTDETLTAEETVETTETVEVSVDRPLLTVPFEEYSVTEGLLLLILLCVVLKWFVLDLLKEGFRWLR